METFRLKVPLELSPRALHEIQPDGANHPLSEGSVFWLTGEALTNLVRDAAKAAGLGDGFTGRIGMARRMVAAGASIAVVQHKGPWRHGDMVARHTKGEVASQALTGLT